MGQTFHDHPQNCTPQPPHPPTHTHTHVTLSPRTQPPFIAIHVTLPSIPFDTGQLCLVWVHRYYAAFTHWFAGQRELRRNVTEAQLRCRRLRRQGHAHIVSIQLQEANDAYMTWLSELLLYQDKKPAFAFGPDAITIDEILDFADEICSCSAVPGQVRHVCALGPASGSEGAASPRQHDALSRDSSGNSSMQILGPETLGSAMQLNRQQPAVPRLGPIPEPQKAPLDLQGGLSPKQRALDSALHPRPDRAGLAAMEPAPLPGAARGRGLGPERAGDAPARGPRCLDANFSPRQRSHSFSPERLRKGPVRGPRQRSLDPAPGPRPDWDRSPPPEAEGPGPDVRGPSPDPRLDSPAFSPKRRSPDPSFSPRQTRGRSAPMDVPQADGRSLSPERLRRDLSPMRLALEPSLRPPPERGRSATVDPASMDGPGAAVRSRSVGPEGLPGGPTRAFSPKRHSLDPRSAQGEGPTSEKVCARVALHSPRFWVKEVGQGGTIGGTILKTDKKVAMTTPSTQLKSTLHKGYDSPCSMTIPQIARRRCRRISLPTRCPRPGTARAQGGRAVA